MNFLFSLITLISINTWAQASNDIHVTLTCFSHCQRGMLTQKNGRFESVPYAVESYTVKIDLIKDSFVFSASATKLIDSDLPVETVQSGYQSFLKSDRRLRDFGGYVGFFNKDTLELSYSIKSPSECTIIRRNDFGKKIYEANCSINSVLDFAGLLRLN